MRKKFLAVAALVGLVALPLTAQTPATPYRLIFDPNNDVIQHDKDATGREGLFITVYFAVKRDDTAPLDPGAVYKVIIEEEGQKRMEVDIARPKIVSEELALVFTMDTSGSMADFKRMEQARKAATTFFEKLPRQADSGLILFNDKVYKQVPPPAERSRLQAEINAAVPDGGTAYLDATADAVEMLKKFANKQKAVVLMTDGVDINSTKTEKDVIDAAKAVGARIYTIGIGKPGKQDPVTSLLVLDRSGSMNLRANDKDKQTKIEALRFAATRFVGAIRPPRRCAVLDFGDAPMPASRLTSDNRELARIIKKLNAQGETSLFDAIYEAIATLEADPQVGKRAVVALTDGIDNKSRRRVEEVVERAKAAGIPLFLLGFGRAGELDIPLMKSMAEQTKGRFYHADDQEKLIRYFEDLYNRIYDDGVDEDSLRALALATGGKYYSVQEADKLQFILEKVTQGIREEKEPHTFPSIRQRRDGVPRKVNVYISRRSSEFVVKDGKKVLQTKEETFDHYERKVPIGGVVIAEMSPFVTLSMLAVLAALIALPALLRRRPRSY